MQRRQFVIGAVLGTASLVSRPAYAIGSTLKLVYPYAPGSGGDVLARLLADDMRKTLGVSAIVENKPGADGRIGVRDVKLANPDGTTLLFTPFGTMVLFPTVFKNLTYDAFNDFTPVTQVVTYNFGFAAGPMTSAKTLAELVDWLKKNPDKSDVGVPGLGALPHLLPLKFAADTGTKIQAIAYIGTAPALPQHWAARYRLYVRHSVISSRRLGPARSKLLAASGTTRNQFVPEVPTFVEQGYDIVGSGWYGIFAPAKTPVAEVAKLNKALVDAIKGDVFQERVRSLWLAPTGTTPAELAAIQKKDFERWAPVIEAAGLVAK